MSTVELQVSGALPVGWTEAYPGGLATSTAPTGGIVDRVANSDEWFAITNDPVGALSGFKSRAEAFAALQAHYEGAR